MVRVIRTVVLAQAQGRFLYETFFATYSRYDAHFYEFSYCRMKSGQLVIMFV